MHIDLRMVNISDFIIAFCPTNIYSVGTVHEIVVARQQHKPVLFVSPPVVYPAMERLRIKTKTDKELLGQEQLTLLDEMETDFSPERPLIKFLDDLSKGIMPKRWNPQLKEFEVDDDWLLMEKVITR